jgi:hypothetical protein
MKMFVNVNIFAEETKLKDTEHSLHFWKKWMPIMVIFPYIVTSDGWARENVCSVFALKKEILLFLQTEDLGQEFQRELQYMGFMRSLAFLADLTSYLNVLNLKSQGRGQTISHLVGHIEGFPKD